MSRFAVTTPIYYVNDVPHLGTAYTTVCADALRRAHELFGDATFLLTGTDEHGLKIERQATERGMAPKDFVDAASAPFRAAWPELLVRPDHFVRTTDEAHKAFVGALWEKIAARGDDLYEGSYEDWYCVGCESFKTEKELEQPGNMCTLHKKPVERLKEDTYFFRLSRFQERLLALYEARPDFIRPRERRNEVISFVKEGLRDLSVSRTSFSWGVGVPGNPRHVMYVWFDALTNYLSSLEATANTAFWPKKGHDATLVHLVGKDILRFHAVYWPAFLFAAGYSEDELPTTVFAHGFLTVDGQKMSKSLRNAVDPLRLARELGPDVLRYQLLRGVAFGQDGDFDHAAMLERYNADLGKNLGNLLQRTLGLCTKLTGGKRPAWRDPTPLETDLVRDVEESLRAARAAWSALEIHRALEHTWEVSSRANQYVDRAAPWATAKAGDTARTETILATLLEVLRLLGVAIWPAMPQKSDALLAQLGLAPLAPLPLVTGADLFPTTFAPLPGGEPLATGTPLFPMFDKDQVAALLAKLAPPKSEPEASAAPEKTSATAPAKAQGKPDDAPAEPSAPITYDDFARVELRVGLVTACERVPKKDKLLRLTVDLGEPTARTIVAGLAQTFTPEALTGQRVVVVANLAPRDFGKGLVSHGMVLATGPSDALVLATAPETAAPGARLK
ncbi:MAG: methionine--tRNA ligase [Myxococcales bacterium]|nr:methionine--tRNA ligase [Myxococcales bacterium]HQY63818.1 methionine--tRNA ligase [Polyangiaceae bacterium]